MTLKNFLKRVKLSEKTISAVLGGLVIVVAGILLFNFFRSQGGEEFLNEEISGDQEVVSKEEPVVSLPKTHRVSLGENLWKIAEDYYGSGYNWVDIAEENNLSNADLLLVGQELSIPNVAVRLPENLISSQDSRVNTYIVQSGDSLWKIAIAVYGDGYQWTSIYQANMAEIGSNPGLIYSGTVLVMP